MKTKNMIWAALSMTAALVMTACTNDDNAVETPAVPQAEVKTIPYSVTVGQGGDAATTRATVDDDMKTLRFAAGDKLYIESGERDDLKGILTLKAGDEGKSSDVTFEGTISYTGEAPADGIWLTATLVGTNNVNFVIEDGKVAGANSPSAYYDDVKTAVEEYSYVVGSLTYGEKEFTLYQTMAFLNFEITFEDGTADGTTLTTVVSNGDDPAPLCSADVTTTTEGGKVVAKFVLPVDMGTTLSGATVKMDDKFALIINDATLDGKVYNVKRTVKTMKTTTLSTIASDYEAQDYEVLTGELTNEVKISIADGAIVTLKDVDINGSGTWEDGISAGITCEGDATIILEGDNTVKGLGSDYPGIYVPEGKTLTIMGTGKLTASSGEDGGGYRFGAGIGGGVTPGNESCGNIVIKSGTIVATGGGDMDGGVGAGIGGSVGTCGNITISGGNVTAKGGDCSAGIGGGYDDCGNITISGGTVHATGGGFNEGGAGIGSGLGSSCGDITISGGTITAQGGTSTSNDAPAAGIGGGYQNTACGVITITAGVTSVTAKKGGDGAQSIGKGKDGEDITVDIEDATLVTQN